MKKKILALILARKNSKRIPGKNLRKIGKKTLVEWSIDSVKGINDIIDILVSSDDKTIVKIAKKNGAIAPFLRPKYLSKDNTSSEDSSMHAIRWYEKNRCKIDGFFLLQPTTPFRSKEKIKKAISIFNGKEKKPILSVSKFLNNYKRTNAKINGSFYLSSTQYFKRYKNLSPKKIFPIEIKVKSQCLDIDTIDDLNLARKYYKKNKFKL
jgi:CMP-N,N'-diacetyllegionaminic acid synthase